MDADVRNISDHMMHFGLSLLGHSLDHTLFMPENRFRPAFGILHAAQAAEILIKASIATEHPLLIFSELPKPSEDDSTKLTFDYLLAKGKTVQYSKLPDVLWAATGYKLQGLDKYHSFGLLRNQIQHLAVPDIDFTKVTLEYAIQVIDPLLVHFWEQRVFDELVVEDHYIHEEGFLREVLVEHGIEYDGALP